MPHRMPRMRKEIQMSIRIDAERVFYLETDHTMYRIKADETGVLLHLWYGRKTGTDMSGLIRTVNRGFSGNPWETQDRYDYSLDTLPQEYATDGVGDYRSAALQATLADGSRSVDWRYAGHRLLKGKEKPESSVPAFCSREISISKPLNRFRQFFNSYGFLQFRSRRPPDSGHRPRCRPRHLGCHQPAGRIWKDWRSGLRTVSAA